MIDGIGHERPELWHDDVPSICSLAGLGLGQKGTCTYSMRIDGRALALDAARFLSSSAACRGALCFQSIDSEPIKLKPAPACMSSAGTWEYNRRPYVPLQILARATVIPNGEVSGSTEATTSFLAALGRLSAGKADKKPAMPAVKFCTSISSAGVQPGEGMRTICVKAVTVWPVPSLA